MRTAILTDIHANLEALTACISAAEAQKVDRFVCLGDTVGYGADPNAACDLVRAKCDFAVLGNHDAAVAGRMDYSYYYAAAREVLDWTALQLSKENMQWLRGLPYQVLEGEVTYGHASPRDPQAFEYVFALEQAEDLLARTEKLAQLTFIGHSHLQRAFRLGADVVDVWQDRLPIEPGGAPGQAVERTTFVSVDPQPSISRIPNRSKNGSWSAAGVAGERAIRVRCARSCGSGGRLARMWTIAPRR